MRFQNPLFSLVRGGLFTANLAVFTVLFLLPSNYLTHGIFDWWDKAQHAIAFIVLCTSGFCSHPRQGKALFWLLIVYGGTIELLQSLTGWRQGDGWDWLADSTGVLLFYTARSLVKSFRQASNLS